MKKRTAGTQGPALPCLSLSPLGAQVGHAINYTVLGLYKDLGPSPYHRLQLDPTWANLIPALSIGEFPPDPAASSYCRVRVCGRASDCLPLPLPTLPSPQSPAPHHVTSWLSQEAAVPMKPPQAPGPGWAQA